MPIEKLERDGGGRLEVRRGLRCERDRDRRDAEQIALRRRRDRSRVDRVIAHVRAQVDSRYHEIGKPIEKTGDGEMHAIGRRAVDEQESVRRATNGERPIERQRVRSSAPIGFGRDDGDLGARRERGGEALETRSEIPVVIGKQDAHRTAAIITVALQSPVPTWFRSAALAAGCTPHHRLRHQRVHASQQAPIGRGDRRQFCLHSRHPLPALLQARLPRPQLAAALKQLLQATLRRAARHIGCSCACSWAMKRAITCASSRSVLPRRPTPSAYFFRSRALSTYTINPDAMREIRQQLVIAPRGLQPQATACRESLQPRAQSRALIAQRARRKGAGRTRHHHSLARYKPGASAALRNRSDPARFATRAQSTMLRRVRCAAPRPDAQFFPFASQADEADARSDCRRSRRPLPRAFAGARSPICSRRTRSVSRGCRLPGTTGSSICRRNAWARRRCLCSSRTRQRSACPGGSRRSSPGKRSTNPSAVPRCTRRCGSPTTRRSLSTAAMSSPRFAPRKRG